MRNTSPLQSPLHGVSFFVRFVVLASRLGFWLCMVMMALEALSLCFYS
jgi:hypothetical protein